MSENKITIIALKAAGMQYGQPYEMYESTARRLIEMGRAILPEDFRPGQKTDNGAAGRQDKSDIQAIQRLTKRRGRPRK